MEKQEIINTFCTVFKDFISDMYKSYPDPSLLMLQQATFAMILTDSYGLVKNFKLCIDPYADKILKKDESFFLDGGLESELSSEDNVGYILEEIKKIANIWKNPETPEKTKQSIWKYLQILVKLSKKVA